MKAVVTGADGFAGRWLCRYLLTGGVDVTGWVRREPLQPIAGVRYRVQDIRDRAESEWALNEDSPNQVFHLAALTHLAECADNPADAQDINVQGAVNVFRAMPAAARGVFASTCHVYGAPQADPITEDHPLNPQGVYAQSKANAEAEIRALGKDVVIARAFHHTGPGQSARYVLADWAAQVRAGVAAIRVGDIRIQRDFSDVRDVVAGYVHLAQTGESGGAYNLCSGSARPLSYYLDCLTSGTSTEVVVDERRLRPGEVTRFCGDPSRAHALGWSGTRPIEDTLAELIRAE